jgi:ankyrin repeat protein
LLGDSNLDINWKDANGFTAPMWAIAYGNHEVIKAIFSVSDINWNLTDVYGKTNFGLADHLASEVL